MIENFNNYLIFGEKFVDSCGELLKKHYQENVHVEAKSDGSFVTNIDKEIESLFLKKIKKAFPDHGVLGEEFGHHNPKSKYLWVIDPLDGTHSFIAGKPLFGTLLCLTIDGTPSLGIIDMPILNERWVGATKIGVKKNKKECAFINCNKKLSECILSSTSLLMFDKLQSETIRKIYSKIRFRIFGTDCYAYGLLISGNVDMVIEANMKPWDYMAQNFLIKEIGGYISDWSGNPLTIYSSGNVIAAKSKPAFDEALEFLKEIK